MNRLLGLLLIFTLFSLQLSAADLETHELEIKDTASVAESDVLSLERVLEGLTSEDAEVFLKRRQYVLDSAFKSLSHPGVVFGIGGIIKDKIVQVFKRGSPRVSITLRERREAFVTSSVAAIDKTLMEQAKLVVDATELGLQLNVGIGSINGMGTKGSGFMKEVGISLGVNFKESQFVFDLFTDSEKLIRTFTPTSAIGLTYSLAVYFGNLTKAEKANIKGVTYYPPLVPASMVKAPNYFSAGYASSMGWPPGIGVYSPADVFSYEMALSRSNHITVQSKIIFGALLMGYKGTKLVLAPVGYVFQMLSKISEYVRGLRVHGFGRTAVCSRLML